MRRYGVFAGCVCLLAGLLVLVGSDSAQGGGGKKKIDLARLKIIIKKLDPEIRAAQKALQTAKKDLATARARLKAAIEDEVFGEKGPTEGRVIDLLKSSVKSVDRSVTDIGAAIKAANIAQLIDRGGD